MAKVPYTTKRCWMNELLVNFLVGNPFCKVFPMLQCYADGSEFMFEHSGAMHVIKAVPPNKLISASHFCVNDKSLPYFKIGIDSRRLYPINE